MSKSNTYNNTKSSNYSNYNRNSHSNTKYDDDNEPEREEKEATIYTNLAKEIKNKNLEDAFDTIINHVRTNNNFVLNQKPLAYKFYISKKEEIVLLLYFDFMFFRIAIAKDGYPMVTPYLYTPSK